MPASVVQVERMPDASPLDPPARVLLAEDDPDLRATLRAVLEEHGYEVLAAGNGSETLAILSGVARHALPRPHVIVSDVRMPGLDGLDLLRAVRLAEWTTPVVLMTAFPDLRIRERASWLGAFALLEKPLGIARLLDVVAAALLRD
ncbi:MAG: response regulator [Myxococcales bacterium]|nr:response regulator [Myxococcales bacterium]